MTRQMYIGMRNYLWINPSTVLTSISLVIVILLCGCNEVDPAKKNQAADKKEKPDPAMKESNERKIILCFGNSLTEGYGLKSEEAYPALLQNRIDSLGYRYKVINAGISGETTAGGKSRIGWTLKNKVDVFLLELGANDGLRGIKVEQTEKNLQSIIDTVISKYPKVKLVLAGMQIPPNLGIEYTKKFQLIYPRLAEKNKINLIPFLLEGVAGNPELNQKDGIHPTAEATKKVLENVWSVIKPLLDKTND